MDLEDIIRLLNHTRTIGNVYYSDNEVENPMDDQQLPESLLDSFNMLEEIEGNSDLIDLEEFKDILTDDSNDHDMFDVNPSILNDRDCDDSYLITDTKSLMNLDDSNVMLRDNIVQDVTDVPHIRKTDIFNSENVTLDNMEKIEIEVAPFSVEQTVKVNKTIDCKTDNFKTSLPNFHDAFKMFINAPFNTSAYERTRIENELKYDEVNAENLQKDPEKETGLKITTIEVTDESDNDDITLVEDQTETYESILANNVKFLYNDKPADDKFALEVKATEYDSDCPGYHSSDFEFITESEAEMDGLIVNDSKSKRELKKNKAQTHIKNVYCRHYKIHKHEEEKPKEHKIPEGEEYFNLFQGNNEPTLPMHYMMENKSLGATSCMAVEYEGIGFDMRMMREDDVDDDELKEDAKRSVKKILEMYPFENCKRKRRH